VARIVTAAAVQPTQSAWANGMRQTDNTAVRQLLRAGEGQSEGLLGGFDERVSATVRLSFSLRLRAPMPPPNPDTQSRRLSRYDEATSRTLS